MPKVLVVDDERNIRKVLSSYLRKENFGVETARNYEESVSKVDENEFDLILTDMKLPGKSGLDLLKWVKVRKAFLPVIVITAYGTINSAVEAMRNGASNYLTKPIDMDEMLAIIKHTLLKARLPQPDEKKAEDKEQFGIIGRSHAIHEIISTIHAVSGSRANVLISGESGTGKELVASAVHHASPRKKFAFVAINCSAIPAELIENELFGHEAGAYTGAVSRDAGKVEVADKGTLFLDEIGEMPVAMQIKLLRFVQQRDFFRIGGKESVKSDCRIIAATNRNLEEEIRTGRFREDLFYRLNVIPIKVPPLRERKEDIPLLVEYFLKKYAEENQKFIRCIDQIALEALMEYDYPGNIRELGNIIERAVVLTRLDTIVLDDLPKKLKNKASEESEEKELPEFLEMTLSEIERLAVLKALRAENWNQTRAAKRLDITRRQLRTKMLKYKLI